MKSAIIIFTPLWKKFVPEWLLRPIDIYGENIQYTNILKYLGVALDRKLLFRDHVLDKVRKAVKTRNNLTKLLGR